MSGETRVDRAVAPVYGNYTHADLVPAVGGIAVVWWMQTGSATLERGLSARSGAGRMPAPPGCWRPPGCPRPQATAPLPERPELAPAHRTEQVPCIHGTCAQFGGELRNTDKPSGIRTWLVAKRFR